MQGFNRLKGEIAAIESRTKSGKVFDSSCFYVSSNISRLSKSSPLSSDPFTNTSRIQPLSTHGYVSTDGGDFSLEHRHRTESSHRQEHRLDTSMHQWGCEYPRFASKAIATLSFLENRAWPKPFALFLALSSSKQHQMNRSFQRT